MIEQRLVDPKSNEDYFTILNQIANLFSTKLLITNRNYYRINATSLNSIKQVINYFKQFNLRSSKYLDSLDWIEAAKLIIDDKHFTLELFRIGITSTEKGRKKDNFFIKK